MNSNKQLSVKEISIVKTAFLLDGYLPGHTDIIMNIINTARTLNTSMDDEIKCRERIQYLRKTSSNKIKKQLTKSNKKQLCKIAKYAGMRRYSKLKKKQLIDAIINDELKLLKKKYAKNFIDEKEIKKQLIVLLTNFENEVEVEKKCTIFVNMLKTVTVNRLFLVCYSRFFNVVLDKIEEFKNNEIFAGNEDFVKYCEMIYEL